MGYEELKTKAHEKVSNRFLLVRMLAERVRQLDKGAEPLVDADGYTNSIEIALKEIIEDKIKTVITEEDEITEIPKDTDKKKKKAKKKEEKKG